MYPTARHSPQNQQVQPRPALSLRAGPVQEPARSLDGSTGLAAG